MTRAFTVGIICARLIRGSDWHWAIWRLQNMRSRTMKPSAEYQKRGVIRWGMIGCGDVAQVKSGPGFQKATGSQLVAVMRRNGDLAREFAQKHGVPRWYADARELIAD